MDTKSKLGVIYLFILVFSIEIFIDDDKNPQYVSH